MADNGFRPEDHLTDIKGKDYLEVKWRLVWFRQDHPLESGWGIRTVGEIVTDDRAVYRAQIVSPEGAIIAEGTKSETPTGFADYIEKAETGAIGRALAICGYGTQFCGAELEEGERIVDSPVARSKKQAAESGNGQMLGAAGAKRFETWLAKQVPVVQETIRAELPALLNGYHVESLEALPREHKDDLQDWAKAKAKPDESAKPMTEADQAAHYFALREEAEGLGIPTEGLETAELLTAEIAKVRKAQQPERKDAF